MMIFIWIIIGLGIYYFLKNKDGANFKFNHSTGSEEKLKLRYVNGEIDEETYNKMLKAISD